MKIVEQEQLDLKQVQADEIKVKMQGRSVWMALALMVGTRLWLTGAISHSRNKRLIEQVATKVRHMALCRPLLLAVDGFASYVGAFQKVFRSPLPRHGRRGRPRLFSWPDIAIAQVVKHRSAGTLDIQRRIVQGSQQLVEQLLRSSQAGGVITLPTLSGSMPPSGSVFPAWPVALAVQLSRLPP